MLLYIAIYTVRGSARSADEQQAQQIYTELRSSCSLIRHLPATSLRRNKEHAYRLLANKKIQLIVVSQSEFSKKSKYPTIFLDAEPINIEHDCYWLSEQKPQEREDLEALSLPSLAVLRERFQSHMIHELTCVKVFELFLLRA